MQEIEVGDEILEFPDDMPEDEMLAIIRRQYGAPESQDVDMGAAVREAASVNPVIETAREVGEFGYDVLTNAPGSVGDQVEGIVSAVSSPIETAKALRDLAIGTGENIADYAREQAYHFGVSDELPEPPSEAAQSAQALRDFYARRYGSREGFVEAVREDPAGVLLDASALSPAAPRLAAANPLLAVSRGSTSATQRLARRGAEALMESAIKPGNTLPRTARQRITDTALEFGIKPSAAGIEKLNNLTSDIGSRIDGLIASSANAGATVSPDSIFRYLDDLRKRKGPPLPDAADDLKIIDAMEDSMRQSIRLAGKTELSPLDLQKIKRDLYNKVDYTPPGKRKKQTKMEARKDVARAAKEDVAELVPEAAELNEPFGRLLELRRPLERAEGRISGSQAVGLRDVAALGAGGAAATFVNPVLGGAIIASDVLTNPRVSPTVALGLNRVAQGAGAANRALNSGAVSRTMPFTQFLLEQPQRALEELLRSEEYAP